MCRKLNAFFYRVKSHHRNVHVQCEKCPHFARRIPLRLLSSHLAKKHGLSCRQACSTCCARFQWSRGDLGRNRSVVLHRYICLHRLLKRNGFDDPDYDETVPSTAPPPPLSPSEGPSAAEWKAFLRREQTVHMTLEACYRRIDKLELEHAKHLEIIQEKMTEVCTLEEQWKEQSNQFAMSRLGEQMLADRLAHCQEQLIRSSCSVELLENEVRQLRNVQNEDSQRDVECNV